MYIVANVLNSFTGGDRFVKSWFKKATYASRACGSAQGW